MRKNSIVSSVLALVWVVGCTSAPPRSPNEYLTAATLWYQTSGEARALMYQAFQWGRLRLEQDAKQPRKKGTLPPAIVVDVDETVLDNSPFQGRVVLTGENYPKGWDEWVAAAKAKPLPGAVELMTYATNRGVKVFYLTNRKEARKADTIKNLKAVGFPEVNEQTVICRTAENSKEARRLGILKTHRIVFLMGDNLNDFAQIFEAKAASGRLAAVDSAKAKFGTEFIVLPNPMYGDWEASIYEGKYDRPETERDQLRKAALTGFDLTPTKTE